MNQSCILVHLLPGKVERTLSFHLTQKVARKLLSFFLLFHSTSENLITVLHCHRIHDCICCCNQVRDLFFSCREKLQVKSVSCTVRSMKSPWSSAHWCWWHISLAIWHTPSYLLHPSKEHRCSDDGNKVPIRSIPRFGNVDVEPTPPYHQHGPFRWQRRLLWRSQRLPLTGDSPFTFTISCVHWEGGYLIWFIGWCCGYYHFLHHTSIGKQIICMAWLNLLFYIDRWDTPSSELQRCLRLSERLVFTSPLTSRLCSQLQELQELPTSPLRMWSSSKKASAYLGSWSGSWTWVQGAQSWFSTFKLSTHPRI